jgi:hypothetical protein
MRFSGLFSRSGTVALALLATGTYVSPVVDAHVVARSEVVDTSQPKFIEFASKLQNDVCLRYVNDSGICETTPGVHTMSGYVDVGTGMSMVCTALVTAFPSPFEL